MTSRARKNVTKREWTQETPYTKRIAARIPLGLNAWLKNYVEGTGLTITDVVILALSEYREKHDSGLDD